jgi:class 3 adenylate cyclase
MTLAVEVANFRHRQSGLRRAPVLGAEAAIYGRQRRAALVDAAIVSPILFLGILYGFLYFLRQKETAYLWFGLFALVLGIRHLFAGEGELILELFPDLPWPLRLRTEYFLFPLSALPAFPWLLRAAGINRIPPVFRGLIAVGAVLVALMALLPLSWLGDVVNATILFTTASMVAGSSLLVWAAWRGLRSAWGPLLGAGVFSIGFVHDALLASGWISGAEIAPLSFLGMLLIEGALLAANFVRSFVTVERLAEELRSLNASLERTHRATLRFVPHAFLALLGRKAVVEVQRGDHTQQTMEILFCDIRGFTPLIEGLGPERAFSFVNRYLAALEPAITSRGGFISQYLGDCIVALFPSPRGSDGAVAAAVEMCERLRAFNLVEPEGPVHVGVGLSSGPLMLGTIGGQERLDGSVIGDPVNQASRIEGLTKEYGVQVLIAEPTRARLTAADPFSLREIDRVITKGKTQVMRIYEVLDALEGGHRDRRLASLPMWHRGREAWERGDFSAARACFLACLAADPDDEPARRQVGRCDKMLADPPRSWDGVTVWNTK